MCKAKCQASMVKLVQILFYLVGNAFGLLQIGKNMAKQILIKAQKNKCLMCTQGFSKEVPMDLHHVDHNRTNNTLQNYALLCTNCHSSHHRFQTTFPQDKHDKISAAAEELYTVKKYDTLISNTW